MDATPAPTPQQQQRGNVSYFLFLSLLFFFLSNGGPDNTTELNYRKALTQLTREREEFAEWLYPHLKYEHEHSSNDGTNATLGGSDAGLQASIPVLQAPEQGSDRKAGNGTSDEDDSDKKDEEEKKHDFILHDLTPPPVLAGVVNHLLEQPTKHPIYYHNISGFFTGSWSAPAAPSSISNISEGIHNLTEAKERQGNFPWYGKTKKAKESDGKVVKLNVREIVPYVAGKDAVKEKKGAEIVIIRGSMELQLRDVLDGSADGIYEDRETTSLDMQGVHYLNNGTFFLHAAPGWMDLDMRQLPGLMLDNSTRNTTGQTVLKELDARIGRIKTALATSRYPDSSSESDGDRRLNCTFSIYGHLVSAPSNIPASRMEEYESELHEPTGRSVLSIPPPTLNAVLFSKECNLYLDLTEMKGLELDRFWDKATTYAAVLTIITAIQTWVLVKQMEYTSTPTAIGKVAHLTISMQVVLDVYFCVTHLTLGIVTDNRSSLSLLVPGFFGILSGLLFGLRYAAIIRVTTYRPPSTTPTTAPAPPAPIPANTTPVPPPPPPAASQAAPPIPPRRSIEIPNTTTPLLPRQQPQSTAPTPPVLTRTQQQIVLGQQQDAEQKKAAILLTIGLILVVLAFGYIGWFPILMAVVYGFWIPQIYHNAERGTGRNPLLKSYILITTLCRLYIPLYVWTCPNNLLFSDTSPWVYLLVAYQVFQVMVLFLQDYFGPRFFLPRGVWFEEISTWDYHPILPPADIEGGDSKTEVDCVICFETIEMGSSNAGRMSVDMRTAEKGEGSGANNVGDVLDSVRRGANRMSFMVPPCHHLAHTSCLESWAAIKMECPLCRRPLPPF